LSSSSSEWDVSVWRNVSSPEGANSDGCSIYDVDFDKFDSIEQLLGERFFYNEVKTGTLSNLRLTF
jgi:hypothetical protein